MSDVIIIGGGISGLWAAYKLRMLGLDVQVFESTNRAGGWIRSQRQMNHSLEWGPHTLLADQKRIECFRTMGLDIQHPRPSNKKRFILWKGVREQVPLAPVSLLTSRFLSWASIRHIVRNFLGGRRELPESDMNLSDFLERYLGREIVDKLADPFVSGIAAGDIRKISARSFMREIYEETQKTGSLLRAILRLKARKPSGRKQMISFKEGLEDLPKALAHSLGASLYLNHRVHSVQQDVSSGIYDVQTDFGVYRAKAVVVATSSYHAADILGPLLSFESLKFLKGIFHQRVMLWNVIMERPARFKTGFGILIPRAERLKLLGSLWRSEIFQDGSDGKTMTAAEFFAGESIPIDPINDSIEELSMALGSRPRILWNEARIYERALPQYELNHWMNVDQLRANLPKGLYLAGNYLEGAGLTALMNLSESITEEIRKYVSTS